MNLYILRHASAGTRRLNPILDLKRPLDKEGKEHCLRLAHLLRAMKVSFDLVISSPLKRALQTAQFVATETGYEAQIVLSNGLAPEANFADFQKMLQTVNGSENLLVVGHSPNLQAFLGGLLVQQGPAAGKVIPQVRLRKGTLARVSLGHPAQGKSPAMLLGVLDPRVVKTLYATSTTRSRRKTSRK
jgi:phosphohistidine phosphatase